VIFFAMAGTIKVQHSNNVSIAGKANLALIGKKTAEEANASLVKSIDGVKEQCRLASAAFDEQHKKDLASQAKLKTQLLDWQKKYGGQQVVIAALDAQAKKPGGADMVAQCKAAESVLNDLNKWRLP